MTPYSWMAPSKTAYVAKDKDGNSVSTISGLKFPNSGTDHSPDPVWRGGTVFIPPEEKQEFLPDWINPAGASDGRGRRAAIGAGLGGVLGAGLGGLTGLFKETFLIPGAQETDYLRSILRGATFGGLGGAGLGALAGSTLGAKNLEDLTIEQIKALRDSVSTSIGKAVEEAQKDFMVTGEFGPFDFEARLGKVSSMNNDYSLLRQHLMEKIAASPAWTRAEGKNPEGGLNAKGRASYKAQTGGTLRPPVTKDRADKSPKDAKRRASFCARSAGQMKMWPDAAKDPESRLRKARRAWDC